MSLERKEKRTFRLKMKLANWQFLGQNGRLWGFCFLWGGGAKAGRNLFSLFLYGERYKKASWQQKIWRRKAYNLAFLYKITSGFNFHYQLMHLLINTLNPELNLICYLLALLGTHHFLHVSRIRVKLLTFRLLMSYIYIYGAPILDVSRSHTTTQHSR